MRLVIALLFLLFRAAGQSIIAEPTRTVQVRSYVRTDGTVVAAYTRVARHRYRAAEHSRPPSVPSATTPPFNGMSGVRCGPCKAAGLWRDRCT
jgi:hypothetical protein